jgi:peptidoglycan/LPS O-acetylase OafA/YrhL
MGFSLGVVCLQTFNICKDHLRTLGKGLFSFLEIAFITLNIVLVCNGDYFKSYGFIFEVVFFLTILVFAFEKGWVSGLMKKSGFLHSTGKYSYSIYMIHTLILSLFNVVFIRVLKLPPSAYAYLFIVNYALIYFLSAWTFKHIEMRFNYSDKQPDKKGWWIW